ncbi:flagellar protein FlhE [Lonsdalea quercina]|uniref:flagellar protein FlhE n=1 Tax=Lonsdalea quercina TaxID=71657 RepID=UPI003974939D
MKRFALMLLLAAGLPNVASANKQPVWEGVNLLISQKGIAKRSALLHANGSFPKGAILTSVLWRYELLSRNSTGLHASLCIPGQCVRLNGQNGSTEMFAGLSAETPFYLVFHVPGKGALRQPMRVTKYQLIVNYAKK